MAAPGVAGGVVRVVTGPSRSGTSLVCQLLVELGADFGDLDNTLPADRWNPNGYFENCDIIRLNHVLMCGALSDAGLWAERSWGRSPIERARRWGAAVLTAYTATAPRIEHRADRYEALMCALAERHRGGVVKDPRFAFTLPAWRARTPVESVLFCVRAPEAVASSIHAVTGAPMFAARLAWHDANRRFWAGPRSSSLIMIDYERLVAPETASLEMRRLYRFLGRPWSDVEASAVHRRTVEARPRRRYYGATPRRTRDLDAWLRLQHAHYDGGEIAASYGSGAAA